MMLGDWDASFSDYGSVVALTKHSGLYIVAIRSHSILIFKKKPRELLYSISINSEYLAQEVALEISGAEKKHLTFIDKWCRIVLNENIIF